MALPFKKNRPIEMSLRRFLDNPAGPGSAFLASRQIIKSGMNMAFIKLLQKHRNQFFAVPYTYPDGSILFHVRVPSEDFATNRLFYDVLVQIDNNPDYRYSLRKARFFSNSPSFVYTYAYVFYHSDLMIEELAGKLPGQSLSQAPSIRNPVETLGYEKSIYVAARYLIDGFILNDPYIQRFGKPINAITQNQLFSQIASAEKIVQIYALGRELMAKTRKREVNQERRQQRERLRQEFISNARKNKPKSTGFIFKRTPRSKITPKKAVRSLMND
jgi:hypothetical protein